MLYGSVTEKACGNRRLLLLIHIAIGRFETMGLEARCVAEGSGTLLLR
jgi:hypothetical protein